MTLTQRLTEIMIESLKKQGEYVDVFDLDNVLLIY